MQYISSRHKCLDVDIKDITIRPIGARDVPGFLSLVESVVDDEVSLMISRVDSKKRISEFLEESIDKKQPHVVCLHRDIIIGWAEVTPISRESMSHVGVLGMGVAECYRRKGFGRRLLDGVLAEAWRFKLQKVELEVVSHNNAAIHLYKSAGFVVEGEKRKARLYRSQYRDLMLMAKFAPGA